MTRPLLGVVAATVVLASCSGPALRPSVAPAAPHREALLILTGFGYGPHDADGFTAVAAQAAANGIDVYVPHYLTRTGLDSSRDALQAFRRTARLDRYERVHVFAFLAGGWTFNAAVARDAMPNLATVVYDRSPFQERAPAIAVRALPRRAWLRYGSTIFDLARTPYPPLARTPGVRIALLVETTPTAFVRGHAREALAGGPFDPACDAFRQPYDDCAYVTMSHDDIYPRFAEIWPEVDTFIHTGRFTAAAKRTPPSAIALALARR